MNLLGTRRIRCSSHACNTSCSRVTSADNPFTRDRSSAINRSCSERMSSDNVPGREKRQGQGDDRHAREPDAERCEREQHDADQDQHGTNRELHESLLSRLAPSFWPKARGWVYQVGQDRRGIAPLRNQDEIPQTRARLQGRPAQNLGNSTACSTRGHHRFSPLRVAVVWRTVTPLRWNVEESPPRVAAAARRERTAKQPNTRSRKARP